MCTHSVILNGVICGEVRSKETRVLCISLQSKHMKIHEALLLVNAFAKKT